MCSRIGEDLQQRFLQSSDLGAPISHLAAPRIGLTQHLPFAFLTVHLAAGKEEETRLEQLVIVKTATKMKPIGFVVLTGAAFFAG